MSMLAVRPRGNTRTQSLYHWLHLHPEGRLLSAEHDSELRMAVAEGLLSREEAEAIKEEAHRLGRNPLELLIERGRLSADTLASLRREASSEPVRDTGDPHNDSTLELPPREEQRATDVPGFPVTGWKRYQCLRLLGQGGMGRVFLAHDHQLRRDVALKFVRDDDPDHMHRFVSEARSQARVSHERVCQVFEVGEVQGRTYIAMQYIDGSPLNQLAKALTLEQKVLVMREVAEGVHAAHRAGLIHRDIKPSNIMVERSDSGLLKPYVMDFGLARDWKEGMTATGSIMGTPHYMAPEQARGEVSRLDRRADVYSLGATLYHLLTGVVPIPGSNSLEVLNNISTLEPRPPRSVDKDIPTDLEAIILKCMEKERSARYDSARAIAEELERFLNGEPVLARSPGLWYRLRKRARKHRALVAVATGALVLLMLSLGWFGLRLRQTERNSNLVVLAQELVTSVERLSDKPYLLPLHDTTEERQQLRALSETLEAGLHEADAQQARVIHYALGRGYQALGQYEKARASLERAWDEHEPRPQVAYALALVQGHLYQEKLLELQRDYQQRLVNKDPHGPTPEQWRDAQKKELEQTYRDPALAHLKVLQEHPHDDKAPAPPPPRYVEALIAFHEDRSDDALAHLDAMGGKPFGFYAAQLLRGDIHRVLAIQHWNQGRSNEARAAFAAARQAYAEAVKIGESDPSVHHAIARLEADVVNMEIYHHGDVEEPARRGLKAIGDALLAAPDHNEYESWLLKALLHRRLVEYRGLSGKDVQELNQQLREALEAARKLAPNGAEAWLEQARTLWQQGMAVQERGQDPKELLDAAEKALQRIGPKEQSYAFHNQRGLLFKTRSDYAAMRGTDSLPYLDSAIEAFRTALSLDKARPTAWLNLANMYRLRASRVNNPEPLVDLEKSRVTLESARALNPQHNLFITYEGLYLEQLAKSTRRLGGDARPHWEQALTLFAQGLTATPDSLHLLNAKSLASLQLAREAWNRGEEPSPRFHEAQATLDEALRVSQEKFSSYTTVGAVKLQRALYALDLGEDPTEYLHAARKAYWKAIDRAPDHAHAWAQLGRTFQLLAVVDLKQGRAPRKNLALAFEALEQARLRNNRYASALAYLAEVQALEAHVKARRGEAQARDFEAVMDTFLSACALDPGDQDIPLAFGHFLQKQATWQKETGRDPLPSLERGLALANALIRQRPLWANPLLLRASLTLTRLEVATHPEPQVLDQTRKDIERALELNGHLQQEAEQQLSRLRKLVTR